MQISAAAAAVTESPPPQLSSFEAGRFKIDKTKMFLGSMFSVNGSTYGPLSATRHLCLGSHSSIEFSDSLIEIVSRWSGPISLALFVPDVEYGIAEIYLEHLRKCYPEIKAQVGCCI